MNSASSSLSSLSLCGSESDRQSRASTPLSDLFFSGDFSGIPLPNHCVQLSCAREPDNLVAVFSKHAVDGLLGIYLPRAATNLLPLDCQIVWTAKSILVNGLSVNYKLATSGLDLSRLEVLFLALP